VKSVLVQRMLVANPALLSRLFGHDAVSVSCRERRVSQPLSWVWEACCIVVMKETVEIGEGFSRAMSKIARRIGRVKKRGESAERKPDHKQ